MKERMEERIQKKWKKKWKKKWRYFTDAVLILKEYEVLLKYKKQIIKSVAYGDECLLKKTQGIGEAF